MEEKQWYVVNTYSGHENKVKEKLENTTRIRVDKERLDDTTSLDTSFLEGRVDAQSKRKVLNSKASNKKTLDFTILRNIVLILFLIILLVLVVLALMRHSTSEPKEVVKKVKEEKIVNMVDDNYIFIGDSHTVNLNFDDLDYHYTKLADDNYTVEDVLDNIEDVYRYNPSVVFIELGYNDLNEDLENVDIVTNLSEIIDGIKENRPYAKIYVESVYPINSEIETFDSDLVNEKVNNENITDLNSMIKSLSKDKKVNYIDIYKEISLDDKLNEEYTDNGLSLNERGYEKVWNLLRKVVD